MGALFKDQGIVVCQQWIETLFAEKLESLSANSGQKDPKTQLQELMQARKLDLPEYNLISMSGLSHEQTFTVKCTISIVQEATVGGGITRKKAEQAAAEQMLILLNKANP